MTRFKPHTLVVPVLGGLLPTATVPTGAARWAGARHRASRRRVGAQAAHGHPRIARPTRTTASHAVSTRRATATVPLRNAPRITEIKRRRRRRARGRQLRDVIDLMKPHAASQARRNSAGP